MMWLPHQRYVHVSLAAGLVNMPPWTPVRADVAVTFMSHTVTLPLHVDANWVSRCAECITNHILPRSNCRRVNKTTRNGSWLVGLSHYPPAPAGTDYI
eukprot:7328838-Pyramimonas_sp.AAC.1